MNKNWIKSFALVLGLGIFSVACEKEIEIGDGRIPAEFLKSASVFVGQYAGQMEGRNIDLEIKIDGENRPSIETSRDLISPKCESEVGSLKKIYVKKKRKQDPRLNHLTFHFNPGDCRNSVRGRNLILTPSVKDGELKIDLDILERVEYYQHCEADYNRPDHGPVYHCRTMVRTWYYRGSVSKPLAGNLLDLNTLGWISSPVSLQ